MGGCLRDVIGFDCFMHGPAALNAVEAQFCLHV